MKRSIMIAMAAVALASCQTDDIMDNRPGSAQNTNNAIRFDGEAGKMSRTTTADAKTVLNEKFIVYGTKTTAGNNSSNTTSVVYDNYNVVWKDISSNTTASNTKGWEYVGLTLNPLNSNKTSGTQQTIKYWDYSASQYEFFALSFGKANQDGVNNIEGQEAQTDGTIKATQDNTNKSQYTLDGTASDLAECYVADKVTVTSSSTVGSSKYGEPVTLKFHSVASKVKIGIYENIPGYSVKNVKFYSNSTTEANAPTLYAESASIPAGKGKLTIQFTENTTTKYEAGTGEGEGNASTISFGQLNLTGKEAQETTTESDNNYIGRSSENASKPTNFTNVLPANVGKLTLKVDYTLISTDGSGEEIKVKGATAEIPAQYTNWQSNYAYTYIFKITDKTNGSTGGDTPGLHPIVFDAVVTETENSSETITIVDKPSITTYAKGATTDEYNAGSTIYVSVADKTLSLAESSANCALYTATATGYDITESNVALCLSKNAGESDSYKLTNGEKNLTVTPVGTGDDTTDKLSIVTEIAAADSPTGSAISGNFAKFKAAGEAPDASTTAENVTYNYYVFEYTDKTTSEPNQQDADETSGTSADKKYYKVIKIKAKKNQVTE